MPSLSESQSTLRKIVTGNIVKVIIITLTNHVLAKRSNVCKNIYLLIKIAILILIRESVVKYNNSDSQNVPSNFLKNNSKICLIHQLCCWKYWLIAVSCLAKMKMK